MELVDTSEQILDGVIGDLQRARVAAPAETESVIVKVSRSNLEIISYALVLYRALLRGENITSDAGQIPALPPGGVEALNGAFALLAPLPESVRHRIVAALSCLACEGSSNNVIRCDAR